MSAPVQYRLGPRPLDVAVLLPSGWLRLANNRRLSEKDVASWTELHSCPDADDTYAQLESAYDQVRGQRDQLLDEVQELRVKLAGLDVGPAAPVLYEPPPHLSGPEQRKRLLEVWAKAEDGFVDADAATDAEIDGPDYCAWKRAGELRREGLIVYTGETRTGVSGRRAKVSAITDAGREWLRTEEVHA